MKSLLVKSIAQETVNSATDVNVFVSNLQNNLNELLTFETKVTNEGSDVTIYFEEQPLTFKTISFKF